MDEFTVVEPSNAERLSAARAKLSRPAPKPAGSMGALGAAALAAFSALTLAAAVIMGPGFEEHPVAAHGTR